MTDDTREVFLVPVWMIRRHPHDPNVVRVDSDVMGEAWVNEEQLRREGKKAREAKA